MGTIATELMETKQGERGRRRSRPAVYEESTEVVQPLRALKQAKEPRCRVSRRDGRFIWRCSHWGMRDQNSESWAFADTKRQALGSVRCSYIRTEPLTTGNLWIETEWMCGSWRSARRKGGSLGRWAEIGRGSLVAVGVLLTLAAGTDRKSGLPLGPIWRLRLNK